MINTDKYEGHSKGPWYWDGNLCNDEYSDKHGTEQWAVLDWELGVGDADKQLIADAPLLLEEVKRLREMVMLLDARLGTIHNHALGGSMEDWEQAQASILAECRGEVPHEIHPYPPLDMKNNR